MEGKFGGSSISGITDARSVADDTNRNGAQKAYSWAFRGLGETWVERPYKMKLRIALF